MEKQYKKKNKGVRNIKILRTDEQEKSYFFDIIMKRVETMSRYNVGAYIRLSRDESYSDSDSIDNQIKLADYYCENNDLRIVEKYIDKIIVYEEEKVDIILKYETEIIKM